MNATKALSIGTIVFAILGGMFPASACDWGRADRDLQWCMDKRNGAKGRGEICLNLNRGSSQYMGGVENGFQNCQREGSSKANFANCKATDQDRLYNDGRSMIGLCN